MADTNNNINVEREEEYKEELRRSFDLVKPISLEAAAIFYPTLWEINPATKALFKNTDMVKQGEKLMKVLGVAVSSLRNFEALRPVMQRLGKKHIDYGVTAEMYPCVVQALLITLEKGLGEECTAETKAAWHWVMTLISGVCIEAAREVDPTYGDEKTSEDDATSAANGEKQGEAGEGEGGGGTTSAVGVTVTVTTTTTTTQEKNKTVEATSDAKEAVEEPLADAEANAAVVGAPERSDD